MRRLAWSVALAACASSIAVAAPARHGKVAAKAKHRAKPAPPPAEDDADEAAAEDAPAPRAHGKAKARATRHADADAEPDDSADAAPSPAHSNVAVRYEERDDGAGDPDADVELVAIAPRAEAAAAHAWHLAIGPYLWASMVDASVSVGGQTVDPNGIHFARLDHTIKYGGELVGEGRYGRFSLAGDVIFGAVGIDAGTDVSSLMVNVHGDVSALLTDGAVGVRVFGDDQSVVSLEARGGLRYQRVAVRAAVGVDGAMVTPPDIVYAGADAIAGARLFVRASRRFSFTGSGDIGVFGTSARTWSASGDANMRLGAHVQLSLGWRTLAVERSGVDMKLLGPRVVLQLLF